MRWGTGLSLAAAAALLVPGVGCETARRVATGVDQALYVLRLLDRLRRRKDAASAV